MRGPRVEHPYFNGSGWDQSATIGSMLLLENSDELPKGLYVGRATVLGEEQLDHRARTRHSSITRAFIVHPAGEKGGKKARKSVHGLELFDLDQCD
jgi:hypothetical protein